MWKFIFWNVACVGFMIANVFYNWFPYPQGGVLLLLWLFGNTGLVLGICAGGPPHAGM